MSVKVYEIVADRLIAKMEAGVVPWRKTWKDQVPCRNFDSGAVYRGVNVLLTSGAETPYFLTEKKIKELGGWIKKDDFDGRKYFIVVFWHFPERKKKEDEEGEENQPEAAEAMDAKRAVWMRYYYKVWNLSQIENLDPEYVESRKLKYEGERVKVEPIAAAENIIFNMPELPMIRTGAVPKYIPKIDEIEMPEEGRFAGMAECYATMFHELAHATGHKKRVGRKTVMDIIDGDLSEGADAYGKEELIAEIAAAFLCGVAGIEKTIENQAAYLRGWLDVLKGNKRMLIDAAQAAQKAADWILNVKKGE